MVDGLEWTHSKLYILKDKYAKFKMIDGESVP